ncbi:MAG TPA: TolC family outer membrane protein [Novosphingobium sp.]|uniref:TolC family outer membrane protein n=1 Tax=Rhizorhapis sp. TaxID=1968842 RepID=UPI002B46A197|nr:TolC family outer membrane protein [Rhizorhapis sp.]HKR16885.1 TolC family outer membrane protein [Rhizorhapis sp.]HKX78718.1 TolC family outer membrane protein [Novosphingobium sp.]
MRKAGSALLMGLALAPAFGSYPWSAAHAAPARAYPVRADGATRVSEHWRLPKLDVPQEPAPTETLADALDAAYRSAPALQARRYDLRASDEDYAQALAELRPTVQAQIGGSYSKTVPGRTTQADRPLADRLASPIITTNNAAAEMIVDQPLYTGGKASADAAVAREAIHAGREELRATEGDLFLRVITAYADVRRDSATLALRKASVTQLESTFYEVTARRQAGELTRTDIAQASTQVDAAIATSNLTEQQLQQDRSAFAALVGHDPGILAPEPPLPQLPHSLDAAFDLAQRLNPGLSQAIATERASRVRIAAAKAEGHPRVSLRGTARLGGQAAPFSLHNEDQEFAGQAVLTIPLWQGGRTSSLVAQARDRNAGDRERIEEARRVMVQAVVDAWNGVATAQRNLVVQEAQLASARVLDEGTFQEYRAGLRSTFDVLFAHGSLRDAEIALVSTRRDLYVAQATLLRQIGLLEARSILSQTPLYDPTVNTREAARRNALPFDPALRSLDRVAQPEATQRGLEQPSLPDRKPEMMPATTMPSVTMTTTPALPPLPSTVGTPKPAHRRKRP